MYMYVVHIYIYMYIYIYIYIWMQCLMPGYGKISKYLKPYALVC